MIHVVRAALPRFDPDPGHIRTKIGEWWVEWSGTEPTYQEVFDFHVVPQQRMQAEADGRAKNLRDKMAELATKSPSKAINGSMQYDAVSFWPDRSFHSATGK